MPTSIIRSGGFIHVHAYALRRRDPAGELRRFGDRRTRGLFGCRRGSVSYDGNWSVLVQINSCYIFSNTATVTVSGGAFSGTLFTYCANAQTGATRLSTTGCGSDISETVSIQQGTMSGSSVAGNLFLAGGACNGGNGFSGGLSATSGQAGSFWGTLAFTKM